MSKNIIICFDGTSNDPEDAQQDVQDHGAPIDDSITNIAKLFLIFGGTDPSKFNKVTKKQICRYYSGVGTHGRALERLVNYTMAPEWLDVGRILKTAGKDLKEQYKKGDKIFLFGFSRGAALARRFASTLHEYIDVTNVQPIEFLGVFDTVAAMGEVNLGSRIRPASDVIFENNKISPNIKSALHLLALDEKRNAFKPTLMENENRVREIWFSGAHGDIGGGYYHDGLSDITLQFMLEELDRLAFGLKMIPPHMIDFDKIDYIDYDDAMIDPQPLAISHQKSLLPGIRTHRDFSIEKGKALPVLHHSVLDRINGLIDYKPLSLKKVPHLVFYGPDEQVEFRGLTDHIAASSDPLEKLDIGDIKTQRVFACHKANKTRLMMDKGETYIFHLEKNDDWYDKGIKCGPGGWDRESEELGLKEIPIAMVEFMRRNPDANWFELCGEITPSPDKDGYVFSAFEHRKRKDFPEHEKPLMITKPGILTLFANDLPSMYGNNRGFVTVSIERLS